MNIIEIHSIGASLNNSFIVDLTYKDAQDTAVRGHHVYRANDPYGLSPLIKEWILENSPVIHPYIPPEEASKEWLRQNMPQLSMVDFRRKLRSIKVVEREGETELDGIYEADILEKIDLIADKELAAEARDYFLYAQYIERINPWVEILGGMFGLTPEDIDILWMADNES